MVGSLDTAGGGAFADGSPGGRTPRTSGHGPRVRDTVTSFRDAAPGITPAGETARRNSYIGAEPAR
jgi:hypothetical protein